jgi:hypothetical protein
MSPIEVRVRPNNALRSLVLIVAALAALYWFLGYLPFFAWILGPIALIAVLVNVIRGQGTDPVVIIDDQGVFDKRLKIGVIRWADIRRIKSYSLSGANYISLELHNTQAYESRRPFWLTLLSQAQRLFGMSSISISTNSLDTDHNTLVQRIHEGCGSTVSATRTIEAG